MRNKPLRPGEWCRLAEGQPSFPEQIAPEIIVSCCSDDIC